MNSLRVEQLKAQLNERILVLDGAMGTMIQGHRLKEADFRSDRFRDHDHPLMGNNDLLSLTQPEVIESIHRAYLEAGVDMVETNTFNSNAISQADYGLEEVVYELNKAGAEIAARACAAFSTPEKKRWVIGVLGPTNRTASLSPNVEDPGARNVTFDELADGYEVATEGLLDGGADVLMIETIFDTLNAKAAIYAIEQVFHRRNERWPVMISGTITDASGRTLSGQTSEAFARSVAHADPVSVGFNCALGADRLRPYVSGCLAGHPLVSRRTRTQGYPTRSASTTSRPRRWPVRSRAGRKTVSSTSSVAAAAPPPSTSSASAKRSKVTHRAAQVPSSDSDYAGLEPLKLNGRAALYQRR